MHKIEALPRRVNVIGTSGSGKSTFSKKLAEVMQARHVELDKLFWKANWEMSGDEEFFSRLRQALDSERWVVDGNYTRTVPIKWAKVDLVVWLDYSFPRTLWQALRRALHRAWTQKELWEGTGNRESFRRSFFSKDSIIWWTITTHSKVRARNEEMFADPQYAHIKVARLRSHREAEKLLEVCRSAGR